MPVIKQAKFRHANQAWLALFEHHYINPAQGKGQPEKTPKNLRITWSIRRLIGGVQDLCLSGHWSLERDVYSVDQMAEPAPRGLIKAAFARQDKATPVSDERNTKCCSGITVARNGTISGRFCDICIVAKEQNAKVLAGIAERRRRLFDQEEEST